jgi:phosphohistidine phosphatase SixA
MRVSVALLVLAAHAHAQALSGEALVKALRQGGYVIVMRHASSPRQEPDKKTANPDNLAFERQLDQTGRETAAAMGRALRDLKIPIGEVLSSPTYRALETIRLGQFGKPQTFPELGDGGQNMRAATESQTDFLHRRVKQFPERTNTLIVTHFPNIMAAFPELAANLADGEALIFGPDGKGGAALVTRVKIEDWPTMRP